MARLPRLEIPRLPHLLVQRALPGERLSRDAQDETALKAALVEAARTCRVAVHAYALLPDHLHLLATPGEAGALGQFMQAVGRRYVAHYNRRHGRQGPLWAGRYRTTVIEPAQYLLEAMAFIELHGWRHGLAPWPHETGAVASSLPHHLGERTDPLIQDHALFWALGNTPFEREAAWRRRLSEGQSGDVVQRLTSGMRLGWPIGSATFLAGLSAVTERPLQPRPRGRPPKPTVSVTEAALKLKS